MLVLLSLPPRIQVDKAVEELRDIMRGYDEYAIEEYVPMALAARRR